jgi:hypothetical protein
MFSLRKGLASYIFIEIILFLFRLADATAQLKMYISTPEKSQACVSENKCSGSQSEPWPSFIDALVNISTTDLEDTSSEIELIFLEEKNEVTAENFKAAKLEQGDEHFTFLRRQKLIRLIMRPIEGLSLARLKLSSEAFTIIVPNMMDIMNIAFEAEEEMREIKLRWVSFDFAATAKLIAEKGAALFLLTETEYSRSFSFQSCEFNNLFQKAPFVFKSLMFITSHKVSFSLAIKNTMFSGCYFPLGLIYSNDTWRNSVIPEADLPMEISIENMMVSNYNPAKQFLLWEMQLSNRS